MTAAPDLSALSEQVAALSEQIAALQSRLDQFLAQQPDVPEDVVLAITAAVTAYLGHNAKVRQVRFTSGRAWSQQGRDLVHSRSVPHR